jgi:hypothetical protein
MTNTADACRCDQGWICEQHSDQTWPHDDCPGPGMKCANPVCPFWMGDAPFALNIPWERVYASSHEGCLLRLATKVRQ